MISFCKVTKEYVLDDDTRITPVSNVSIDVKKDEFIVIIGRSGSGKTTFLNLAAGLVRPTSGSITIGGTDLKDMDDHQVSLLRSSSIGFVFQFPSLLPYLPVIENVVMPSMFSRQNGHSNVYKTAQELLQMVGLSERVDSWPRQLSAGEQKRVVLARALVNHPSLVLADEPTSDLDEQTEQEIMKLLRKINSDGVTIIMVTHSLELTSYANRVFKMERGQLFQVQPSSI